MNPKNFHPPLKVDYKVPESPGLYCVRIANSNKIKASLSKVLKERSHNIIYIGIASKSLQKRFISQ